MKKAWFWSCHQVPISVIRSLPVTKKSAKFVAGNKIYDIFQRQIWLWNGFFFLLSLQRNLSLESNFVAQRQVLAATNFLWNAPPPPPPPVSPTCWAGQIQPFFNDGFSCISIRKINTRPYHTNRVFVIEAYTAQFSEARLLYHKGWCYLQFMIFPTAFQTDELMTLEHIIRNSIDSRQNTSFCEQSWDTYPSHIKVSGIFVCL